MKQHKILLLFLLIAISQYAFSQREIIISGLVSEQSSGEVIPNANVLLNGMGVTTNNYGHYSIKLRQGKCRLSMSKVGFATFEEEIDLKKDTTINVTLKQGIQLSELTLSAKQIKNKGLGNHNMDMSVLKTSALFLGEKDIIKCMQFLPGISSGMEGSSQLNIRGGTNDQTLYLMDDVPVYNQNHTFGFLSIFNSEAILNAEIYKGGIPSIYGNRLSGVVNVSLKDGNYNEHHHSFSVGLLAATLELEGPIKKGKASYMFTVRRSLLDLLYKGALYLNDATNSYGATLIAFHDINAKLSWRINPKTKLSWQLYNGYDDFYLENKGSGLSGTSYKEKYGIGWSTLTSSLRLTSTLKPNLFLTNSVYFSGLDNFKHGQYSEDSVTMKQKSSSVLAEVGIRSSLEHKITNNNTLLYGIDASSQFYNPIKLYNENNNLKTNYQGETPRLFTACGYVSNELRYKTWVFTSGLRASVFNNTEKTIMTLEPRIKVSTFAGDNNKFMFAYDMTHQPIHSIYEMNYSIQSDFWVPFKENSIPVSNQLSLGWKNYSLKNFTISIEAYYKKMQNIISIKNLENYLDFHTDYSVGTGHSKGIEMLVEYSKNRLNTSISYTLSKSDRTFDGNTYPFKFDAPNSVSGFVSYDVKKTKTVKKTFSVNVQYKTGYPYYIPILKYPGNDLITSSNSTIDYIPEYPNIRLKDYFRTDINFTTEKKLVRGSRTWQFSLLNATTHKNPYVVYKTKEGKYKAFVLIPILPSISFTRNF